MKKLIVHILFFLCKMLLVRILSLQDISVRFRFAGRFMMAGSLARPGSLCALDDEI